MLSALLTGVVLWGSIYLLPELTLSWSGTALSSLAVGISDWFYHRWLARNGIIDPLPYIEI
jgi:hypothetical protein